MTDGMPVTERSAALDRADAWAPPIGFGHWRVLYAECCDAVLAYDRVVASLPAGPLRARLAALRAELPARLDTAWQLCELAAQLYPHGPHRDARLLQLLADDPVRDTRPSLVNGPSDPGLRSALVAVREHLWELADDAARVAAQLCENPHATDVGAWVRALADGVAQARRAGWTPTGYAVDGTDE